MNAKVIIPARYKSTRFPGKSLIDINGKPMIIRVVEIACKAVGKEDEPMFKLARELEKIALEDEYFISKKLYPNVDFYSGVILQAMGFPSSIFTVLFAVARTVGWVAQWNEMIEDPEQRIGRPRQLYTGPSERDYINIKNRN